MDSLILKTIKEVEDLNYDTPEGIIRDSDTILIDLLDKADFEFSGISQDIFNIYKKSKDKEDLKEMSLNDIKTAISGYYDGILGMEQVYNLPLGQLDDIVAECSFENRGIWSKYESEEVTWVRAENIIQYFINTSGGLFREN